MSRCKVCNAQLKPTSIKCSYCGTLVCKSNVVYHKSYLRKKEIVFNLLGQIFGKGFTIEKEWNYWKISTVKTIEGEVRTGIFRKRIKKVSKTKETTLISIDMYIYDTAWGAASVKSHFEEYNDKAKQIGEKLSEYTEVEVVLR